MVFQVGFCSGDENDVSEVLVRDLPSIITVRRDFISCGRGFFHSLRKIQGNNTNTR